jgi:3-deoxy-D-manno-octulosonic-acid transferase
MENFREMAATFLQAGAAIQVNSAEDLGAAWAVLLRDRASAARMGSSAREMVERNRGATRRVLQEIERVLESNRGAS